MGAFGLLLLLAAPGVWFYACLDRPAVKRMTFADKLTCVAGASVVLTTLYTVALMVLGVFSLFSVLAPYVILACYVLMRHRGRIISSAASFKMPGKRYWLKGALVLAAAALFAALYSQPAEYFVGGRDPGIYVNTAVQISQHYDIMREGPLLTAVRTSYPGVFEDQFVKFPGVYIHTAGGALRLNPQFYHGYSIWLGLSHRLMGMDRFLWLNPLFAMISLLILYSAVRSLTDRKTAIITIFLLGLNISQIWYARSPFTEILSQILLWFGVYMTVMAYRHKSVLNGIIVGLSLNAAILVRLDTVFLIPVYAIFLALLYIKDTGVNTRWIAGAAGAFFSGFLITGAYIMKYGAEYTHFQLVRNTPLLDSLTLPALFFILLAAGISFVLLTFLLRRPIRGLLNGIAGHQRIFAVLLSVLVVAAAAYLYFLRPQTETPHILARGIRSYREESLIRLGWYTTRLGLAAALGGLLLLINAKPKKEQLLFLLLIAVNFALYLYDPRIFPDHFWAVRRHVPFILPALFILAAIFIGKAGIIRFRCLRSWMIPAALTVYFSVRFLAAAPPFLFHTDYRGTREGLEYTAKHFTSNDVVITNDVRFVSRLVGTPLKFVHNKQVLVLREQFDDKALSRFIDGRLNGGGRVYLLIADAYQDLQSPHVSFFPLKPISFDYRVVRSSELYMPNEVYTRRVSMYLYEALQYNLFMGETNIDVGAPQDINFRLTGFHGAEGAAGDTFRWASGGASLRLLGDYSALSGSDLKLSVYAWRLADTDGNLPPAAVRINGREAGSLQLGAKAGWHTLTFPQSLAGQTGYIEIAFSTKAYTPKALGLSEDRRELGFALGALRLEPVE